MSVQAMTWALAQQVVTNSTTRHVLLCLANYADHEGKAAFPSVKTLSRDTGLSERTIKYKLRDLEEVGLIERGNQKVPEAYINRKDRLPVCYDLALDRGAPPAPRSERGANDDINGVQMTTERGAPPAPNPSIDPPIENPIPPKGGDDGSSAEPHAGKRIPEEGVDLSILPDDLSDDVWNEWLKLRAKQKFTVSQVVVNTIANQLERAREMGWSPDEALAEALSAGWRGLRAEWLANRVGNNIRQSRTNRSAHNHQQQSNGGRSHEKRPVVESI